MNTKDIFSKELFVSEIFSSVAGECNGSHQGAMTTFIRLSGCNLTCNYCDTPNTQTKDPSSNITIERIVRKVQMLKNHCICITGGEPLLQSENLISLVTLLLINSHYVSIETNGTIDVHNFFMCPSIVIDYKIDDDDKMKMENYKYLRESDVVKFVINSKEDFYQYRSLQSLLSGTYGCKCSWAYSPNLEKISVKELLYLLESSPDPFNKMILSVQLHKLIGVA